MTEYPLITIVIPTWNRQALLREAIASVVAQTYQNWELVVVDDGSSDGTIEELRASEEPRLRVVTSPAHSGNMSRVRNLGAAAGTGDFIAFLDSDDMWLPRKLELQVAALRDRPARWCYTNYAHVDARGGPLPERPVGFRPDHGRILRSLLLGETAACVCTLLIESSLFDELGGFDESLELLGDLDLELRLAAAADAVALPAVVTLVREHSGRTSATTEHPHEVSAEVFEKFLARATERDLRRIARARRARLLVDGGLLRLARRDIVGGVRVVASAAASGAGLAHLGRRLAARVIGRRSRREAPRKGA